MSEFIYDEFGPCAPGDSDKAVAAKEKLVEEKPAKLASVAPEVSRMLPEAEFAQDVIKRVKAAMDEHVFPIFEEATKRGLVLTWDGLGRGGLMARWQLNNVRILKIYEQL